MNNKQIMSSNIRKQLSARGLNVKDFAAQIDVKYTTVLDWVNGKTYPRIDKIEKMANYFNISKSDLVEEREDSHTYDLAEALNQASTFNGKPLSNEDRESITNYIDFITNKNKKDD